MKLVGKASIATIIGKVPTQIVERTDKDGKAVKVARGIEQLLVRVVGVATGLITGNSTFGEWTAFKGQFEITNVLTGEIFRSGKLFMPDTATDVMIPVVKDAGESGVEFAFDIGAKSCENLQGYEYTITPLMEPSESDPLKMLSSRLLASAPALPAPKPTAQTTLPLTGDVTDKTEVGADSGKQKAKK